MIDWENFLQIMELVKKIVGHLSPWVITHNNWLTHLYTYTHTHTLVQLILLKLWFLLRGFTLFYSFSFPVLVSLYGNHENGLVSITGFLFIVQNYFYTTFAKHFGLHCMNCGQYWKLYFNLIYIQKILHDRLPKCILRVGFWTEFLKNSRKKKPSSFIFYRCS